MPNESTQTGTGPFFPVDLVLTALLGLWLLVSTVPSFGGGLRAVLGLVSVFLAPGYAFVAVLLPRRSTVDEDAGSSWSRGLDSDSVGGRLDSVAERIVLSIGLSVCSVPILGVALEFTPWGITRGTLFASLGGFLLLCSAVAVVRRWQTPPSSRFSLVRSVSSIREANWVGSGGSRSPIQVALVVLLLTATAGLGAAVWHPTDDQGEEFTEFFVQTKDPDTGELGAAGFEDGAPIESPARLHLGITNHEGETTRYTVVTVLQRFEATDGGRVLVSERTLDDATVTVRPGATGRFRHDFDRRVSGQNNRLTYLLYVGDPPADPSIDNAYRDVYVWVDGE